MQVYTCLLTACPYNASVWAVATVNMMAGQPVSVHKYEEGVLQVRLSCLHTFIQATFMHI